MAATSFNPSEMSTGKWQKIYWSEGPEAAQKYCVQTAEKVGFSLGFFSDFFKQIEKKSELVNPLRCLFNSYNRKQERYLPDTKVRLRGDDRIFSRGRAEQGRSPFNYPDFRRKFNDEKKLLNFLGGKVQGHQTNLDAVDYLLAAFPENPEFQKLKEHHSSAAQKWKERKVQAEANPTAFLLPVPQDPHQLMGIAWAHENGYLGEGARAIVIDDGIDLQHPALQNALLSIPVLKTDSLPESHPWKTQKHGTHIVGMITASKNDDNGHIGAAPKAKIEFLDSVTRPEIASSDIDIVHYSGADVHPLVSLLSRPEISVVELVSYCMEVMQYNFNFGVYLFDIIKVDDDKERGEKLKDLCSELQTHITLSAMYQLQNKLFITSNGNEGVILSESPKACEQERYGVETIDQSIRVVNLMPNGLYPNESSTLPGDTYAKATICAIGTDILSTTPGNTYKKMTGTSMAAPFVTSVALLLKGAFPTLSKEEIRACILESATPILLDSDHIPHLITDREELKKYSPEQIALSQQFFGVGLLNAKGAIELAEQKV